VKIGERTKTAMNEFIDAYSDDQIYLTMIRDLVDNHPVESAAPENIKLSSFCRLWAVMMVGSIESMIKVWNTGDTFWADIAAYFDDRSNKNRINRLMSAFQRRGLSVDAEMFQDFLAIKYIRNAYIHSKWKEDERVFAKSRGFPGDVMSFSAAHFERMQAVYFHVMNKLGMVHALNARLRAR
jgi:hypothetical protein